jgi:hypothetical protein
MSASHSSLTSVLHVELRVNQLVALQHLAQAAPLVGSLAGAHRLAEWQVIVVVRLLWVVILQGSREAAFCQEAMMSTEPEVEAHSSSVLNKACCIDAALNKAATLAAHRAHFVDPQPDVLADFVLQFTNAKRHVVRERNMLCSCLRREAHIKE